MNRPGSHSFLTYKGKVAGKGEQRATPKGITSNSKAGMTSEPDNTNVNK